MENVDKSIRLIIAVANQLKPDHKYDTLFLGFKDWHQWGLVNHNIFTGISVFGKEYKIFESKDIMNYLTEGMDISVGSSAIQFESIL